MTELEELDFFSSKGQILIEGVHNSLSFDLPSSYFVVSLCTITFNIKKL